MDGDLFLHQTWAHLVVFPGSDEPLPTVRSKLHSHTFELDWRRRIVTAVEDQAARDTGDIPCCLYENGLLNQKQKRRYNVRVSHSCIICVLIEEVADLYENQSADVRAPPCIRRRTSRC